jgi:hypothetical protein
MGAAFVEQIANPACKLLAGFFCFKSVFLKTWLHFILLVSLIGGKNA